jgi:hypothetical protein
MGVQTVAPSEDKATIKTAIDKSERPSAVPTKDELGEQELNNVSGGAGQDYSFDIERFSTSAHRAVAPAQAKLLSTHPSPASNGHASPKLSFEG